MIERGAHTVWARIYQHTRAHTLVAAEQLPFSGQSALSDTAAQIQTARTGSPRKGFGVWLREPTKDPPDGPRFDESSRLLNAFLRSMTNRCRKGVHRQRARHTPLSLLIIQSLLERDDGERPSGCARTRHTRHFRCWSYSSTAILITNESFFGERIRDRQRERAV